MFLNGSPTRFWPQFLPSCLLAASNLSLLMEGQCPLFALPSPFHPTPIHDVFLSPTKLTYITIWGELVFKVFSTEWCLKLKLLQLLNQPPCLLQPGQIFSPCREIVMRGEDWGGWSQRHEMSATCFDPHQENQLRDLHGKTNGKMPLPVLPIHKSFKLDWIGAKADVVGRLFAKDLH